MSSGAVAVDCTGLQVHRGGAPVVDGVDLRVEAGDWVSVVGPNGAGKTSLLLALAGLVPFTGRLRVGGLLVEGASRRALARTVALMPQRPVVPEGVTVRDLVTLGRTPYLRRFGTEGDHDRTVVHRTMTRLELSDLQDRDASELSGGELQRVVLARSLAQEPHVLLLDEPTSALDIGHQQTVLDLVEDLRVQEGITVAAAMHDLTLAAQYGRRVVMLSDGRVVADGAPLEVLSVERLVQVYGARVEVLDRPGGAAVLPVRAAGTAPR